MATKKLATKPSARLNDPAKDSFGLTEFQTACVNEIRFTLTRLVGAMEWDCGPEGIERLIDRLIHYQLNVEMMMDD